MRYKYFKNAGADISAITVGTWGIGGANSAGLSWGPINDEESIEAIHTMIDNGVNIIDTAPVYGEGHSEKVVGKALKGIRNKVFVSTKFGTYISHYNFKSVRDSRYDTVIKECDNSLKNLQTDYIDFYIMHWPDVNTPIEETMAAVTKLQKDGKIRFIGMSNSPKELITEAQKYAKIDIIQPPFSMVEQSKKELLIWAKSQGIFTMAYGSLGGGILTGGIRNLSKLKPNDMRLAFYPFFKEPQFSKIMELLKGLDKIAGAHKKSVAQVTINWSTQKDYVGTALVGARNSKRAKENCKAFEWELSKEEIDLIDSEIKRLNIS